MQHQGVGTGDSDERPIRLGGALFTMVEPRPGQEVAYNRWYERDHFYAGCMIGAWTIAGARFVATRDLKAMRYPVDSVICPDPMSGSYLALYWVLAGKLQEWIRWGTDQVNWLHAQGRMFTERDHIHTAMYEPRAEFYARDDSVPGRAGARSAVPLPGGGDRRARSRSHHGRRRRVVERPAARSRAHAGVHPCSPARRRAERRAAR